jgi:hypothetical protein
MEETLPKYGKVSFQAAYRIKEPKQGQNDACMERK